jgi:hypothetical protein
MMTSEYFNNDYGDSAFYLTIVPYLHHHLASLI